MITLEQLNDVKVGQYINFDPSIPRIQKYGMIYAPANFNEDMFPHLDYKSRKVTRNEGSGYLTFEGIKGGAWAYKMFIQYLHITDSPSDIIFNDDLCRVEVEKEVDCIILN